MRTMAFRATFVLLVAFVSTAAGAQSVANGKALYQTYCNVCHGTPPSGGPELAPNNPALIRSAINGLSGGAMSFLGQPPISITDAQLADIAAYIASLVSAPPPPPPTAPAPQFDYTDLWYNPAESGWGFNAVQHPSNNIFGVIYTYEAPDRPIWYVLPGGTWTANNIFTGAIYRVAGEPGNVPFNSATVAVTPVGSATLLFTDSNNATLTYTVSGTQVTKQISRQPF